MHGVIVSAKFPGGRGAEADEMLQNQIVPMVKQQPGFVSGTWLRGDASTGWSLVLFDTKEHAEEAAKNVEPPAGAPVSIASVEVGEVVAQA